MIADICSLDYDGEFKKLAFPIQYFATAFLLLMAGLVEKMNKLKGKEASI